jgi:hypothetical protein
MVGETGKTCKELAAKEKAEADAAVQRYINGDLSLDSLKLVLELPKHG